MKNAGQFNRTARKERAIRLKYRVMEMLRWTEVEFGEFQYTQGMAWLQAYLLDDSYGVGIMEQSRTFWNWWKNHWTNRDESFVRNVNYLSREVALQVYAELHDGRILSGMIYPNRMGMKAMINEVEPETVKQ